MAVSPSHLRRLPEDGTPRFSPYATDVPPLAGVDYIQEEWVASGAATGGPTPRPCSCVARVTPPASAGW